MESVPEPGCIRFDPSEGTARREAHKEMKQLWQVALGSTRQRVLQGVVVQGDRGSVATVALGSTRLRVLQDGVVEVAIGDSNSCIRFDPSEGTASCISCCASSPASCCCMRFDPSEGTARVLPMIHCKS